MKAYLKAAIGIAAVTTIKAEALKAQTPDWPTLDGNNQERIRRPRFDSIPLAYVQSLQLDDGRVLRIEEISSYTLPEFHNSTLNEAAAIHLWTGESLEINKVIAAQVLAYESPIQIVPTPIQLDQLRIYSVDSSILRQSMPQMWAE